MPMLFRIIRTPFWGLLYAFYFLMFLITLIFWGSEKGVQLDYEIGKALPKW